MRRFKNFLTNTFIGGLVVLLPILIFAFLINWIIGFFSKMVNPIINLLEIEISPALANVLAIILVVLFCFSVGLFIRTRFGKNVFGYFENTLLKKLPFYSTIKETIVQFVGTDNTPFKEVVLVQPYGKDSAKMLGFVTSRMENNILSIFILTAPNPTSGFVIFVKEKDVEHLDITIEEAMRTNIGLGRGADKVVKIKDWD